MKAIVFTTLLCALSGAYAQQSIETVRVPATLDRIEVPAKTWSMALSNFDVYKGAYDLSDGRTLSLTSRGSRMYAEIDGSEKVEIKAASQNSFVGVDRSIQLNLTRLNDGEVRGDVYLAKPALAGMPATLQTFAFVAGR